MTPIIPMKPIIADTLKNFVGVLHTHADLIPFIKILDWNSHTEKWIEISNLEPFRQFRSFPLRSQITSDRKRYLLYLKVLFKVWMEPLESCIITGVGNSCSAEMDIFRLELFISGSPLNQWHQWCHIIETTLRKYYKMKIQSWNELNWFAWDQSRALKNRRTR